MDLKAAGALEGYAGLRPAIASDASGGDGLGARLGGAARDFAATLQQGEAAASAAMTGRADSHALVTALAQSQLAVETVVAVRNKVVEAYQELLRMPV